jgi:hypothetical protein
MAIGLHVFKSAMKRTDTVHILYLNGISEFIFNLSSSTSFFFYFTTLQNLVTVNYMSDFGPAVLYFEVLTRHHQVNIMACLMIVVRGGTQK